MVEQSLVEQVDQIVLACLSGSEDEGVVVKGIMRDFAFDEDKIAEHKEQIKTILDQMPDEFHKRTGGGWSFLNLCMTKAGHQWGEHSNMEALIVLAIAAGYGQFQMPRDMWSSLPGGMPYVVFDTLEPVTA